MKLLINKTHISKYRQLAQRIDNARLTQFIQDAQYIDLQKIMCSDFYYTITENDTSHSDLLDGCTYVDGTITKRHEGLRSVLALFSYARYVRFGSAISTAYDMVNKTNEQSQSITETDKQIMYTENRKIAMSYWHRVKHYLDTTNYTGWEICCNNTKMTGFKLNVITKE